MKKIIISFLVFIFAINITFAEDKTKASEKKVDVKETAMHHIKDAHQFAIWGNDIVMYLPVILWTDKGLVCFSSCEFENDDSGVVVAEKEGQRFVKYHEKIYYAEPVENAEGGVVGISKLDENNHPTNKKPLDFSITKNVFSMFMSILLLIIIFVGAARSYSGKNYKGVPRGIASFVEPLVVFVRDEIAIPNIGEKKYKKYIPYLLTVFFFIWINNIIGLIPFFPFNSNLTGNIAFTCTLALCTFIITIFSGNSNYWKHILWVPGVPVPMKLFLMPIEIIGMFTKPISLMIRLFANISAGHIIIISLISLIFLFQSYAIAPVSILFAVFITIIEILVVAIQAYIFTILSALYFGMAVEEEH